MTPETTTASATGFRHFHDQLSSLKEQLLGMSAKAEERTDLAVEALLGRDRDKANLVIAGDADLICRVVARDTEHLQEIVNGLVASEAIQRCTSHIVLSRQVSPRTAPLIRSAAQPVRRSRSAGG